MATFKDRFNEATLAWMFAHADRLTDIDWTGDDRPAKVLRVMDNDFPTDLELSQVMIDYVTVGGKEFVYEVKSTFTDFVRELEDMEC